MVRDLARKIGEQIDQTRKAVQQWQSMAEANHRLPARREGLAVVRAITQWTTDYKADAADFDFPSIDPIWTFTTGV